MYYLCGININDMKPKQTITLFIVDLILMYLTTHVGDNGGSVETFLGVGLFRFYVIILIGYLIYTPIGLLLFIYINHEDERNKKLQKYRTSLWISYQNALNSGDKRNSIIRGREYYSSIGLYDEQRIQNDLLCFLNTKQ